MGKKLLIAGYPKSGNTWLGYMVSYLLGAKYIDLHDPDQKPKRKWILDLIEGNVDNNSDYEIVAKTHDLPINIKTLHEYDKIIYIVRDPRDVATSFFFYKFYNLPIFKGDMERLFKNKFFLYKFWKKKKIILKTAKEWSFSVITWQAYSAFEVKYENLNLSTLEELKRICDYLESDCTEDLLKSAIDLFSFEKLSGGRKKGDENNYHFFRKGVVGDYKNHFDFIDSFIVNQYAKDLMKLLNYN